MLEIGLIVGIVACVVAIFACLLLAFGEDHWGLLFFVPAIFILIAILVTKLDQTLDKAHAASVAKFTHDCSALGGSVLTVNDTAACYKIRDGKLVTVPLNFRKY